MRSPALKTLVSELNTTVDEATLIRALCAAADDEGTLLDIIADKVPGTDAYERRLYHRSPYNAMWRRTLVMHAINEILRGHGVECLGTGADLWEGPSYEYINFGDPYAATLIYSRFRGADNLYISDWATASKRVKERT